MPTLPTLTVTDAQMSRITAAWPGATAAEKATNYRRWLAAQVLDAVQRHELHAVAERHNGERLAALAAAEQALPNPDVIT